MNKMRVFHYNEEKYGKVKDIENHIYPVDKLNFHFLKLLNKKTGEIFYCYLAKVGVVQNGQEQVFYVDYEGKKWTEEWSDIIEVW